MLLSTTDDIGKKYEIIGLVEGSVVQSRHIGRDILAGLKTIIGGEIKSYSELMEKSRSVANQRMIDIAKSKGANAIVGVKYQTADVMQGAAEVMVYGTAVKFK